MNTYMHDLSSKLYEQAKGQQPEGEGAQDAASESDAENVVDGRGK